MTNKIYPYEDETREEFYERLERIRSGLEEL